MKHFPLVATILIWVSLSTADICLDLPGYMAHGTSCFKLYSVEKTWHDAEASCVADGGHLASIHSSEEQAFIVSLAGPHIVYIGITGIVPKLAWSDNTDMDYDGWRGDQPNGDGEQCGRVRPKDSYLWTDIYCTSLYYFVCRADKPVDQAQAFFKKIPDGLPVDAAVVPAYRQLVMSVTGCAQKCLQDTQCVHFIMTEDGANYFCEIYTTLERPSTATPPTDNYQKIV